MKSKGLIYIAGPYSGAEPLDNVINAINAAETIAKAGYTPYVPHLNHYWDVFHKHNYEFWMDQGSNFLSFCDALVRLPGESPGADREVEEAKALGLHIYMGVDALLEIECDRSILKVDYT